MGKNEAVLHSQKKGLAVQTTIMSAMLQAFLSDKNIPFEENYTLISTSTPLGSSSFISASTVLAVEL